MKSFFKRFSPFLLSFLYVIGIFFASTTIATGTVFFSTDWDTGTAPAGWPCKNAPNAACSETNQFYGWTSPLGSYCSNGDNAAWTISGVTTSKAHSGTKSFRMYRPSGYSSGCDIQHKFSTPYPTTIYVRFYLYLPASVKQYSNPTSKEPFTHFLFTNSAFSGTGFRINLLSRTPWGGPQDKWCGHGSGGIGVNTPYMFFNVEMNSSSWAVGSPSPCYNLIADENLDRWQAVEFKLDAAAKTYSVWIDGKQYVNNATSTFTQNNFTMLQFASYESETPSGYTMDYYIDDIVVADSYIGPMSSDQGQGPARPNPIVCNDNPNDPRCLR
jgi:hypothetical protein